MALPFFIFAVIIGWQEAQEHGVPWSALFLAAAAGILLCVGFYASLWLMGRPVNLRVGGSIPFTLVLVPLALLIGLKRRSPVVGLLLWVVLVGFSLAWVAMMVFAAAWRPHWLGEGVGSSDSEAGE
jgi:hypothetical protein